MARNSLTHKFDVKSVETWFYYKSCAWLLISLHQEDISEKLQLWLNIASYIACFGLSEANNAQCLLSPWTDVYSTNVGDVCRHSGGHSAECEVQYGLWEDKNNKNTQTGTVCVCAHTHTHRNTETHKYTHTLTEIAMGQQILDNAYRGNCFH